MEIIWLRYFRTGDVHEESRCNSCGGSLASICQSSLFLMFGLLKDYRISMAGSRSDLIYRYSCTCDKCTRSTAAVEAAAAGALGADRKRVVHGDDDQNRRSLMTWIESTAVLSVGF